MTIREIKEEDATELLELNKQLDSDNEYMLYEPGERTTTEEQQLMMIKNMLNSANSAIFVAEEEGKLVGHLTVIGGGTNRIKHRAHFVIGILNAYTGQLYKKLGFEIEGIKKNSMRINNRSFVDEYYMGKTYAAEIVHEDLCMQG